MGEASGSGGGRDDRPLRATILVDETVRGWVRPTIQAMFEEAHVDIPLVVVNEGAERETTEHVSQVFDEGLWTLIKKLRWKFPRGVPDELHPIDPLSVPALAESRYVRCSPEPAPSFGNELPDDLVSTIAETSDVVVRFGFGILKGDVLTATDHGVLSFHHADLREYRGAGSNLRMFLDDASEGRVTLQRLTEEIDAGYVVAEERVDLAGTKSVPEIKGRLLRRSPKVMVTGIQRLRDPSFEPEQLNTMAEMEMRPGNAETIRYLSKRLRGALH